MSTVWGWIEGFGKFWYDFFIGDDWTIAAGVCLALGGTYALLRTNVAAWWLTPVAAIFIVTFAVRRANARETGNGEETAVEAVREPESDEPPTRDSNAGERERAGTR